MGRISGSKGLDLPGETQPLVSESPFSSFRVHTCLEKPFEIYLSGGSSPAVCTVTCRQESGGFQLASGISFILT